MLASSLAASAHPAAAQDTATAAVGREAHQVMKGWGVFAAWPERPQGADLPTSAALQRALYRDLGATVVRVKIQDDFYDAARDGGSVDTALVDSTLVRHRQVARARGLTQYIATAWSPPAAMKTCATRLARCPDSSANRLRPEREGDFVRYHVAVLRHLVRRGLGAPLGHSIQNELGSLVRWDGCIYRAEQYQRVVKALRRALDAAEFRTVEQDAAFGIRQMVDVAVKALSPGINDTTTAITAVDALGAVLVALAVRLIEERYRRRGGRVRVIARAPTFASLVTTAVDEIRQNAEGSVSVLARLLGTLEVVGARTSHPARRQALLGHAAQILTVSERTVPDAENRAEVRGAYERVRTVTEEGARVDRLPV